MSVEEEVRTYLKGIKEGYVRGDAQTFLIRPTVVLEISVGPFEYGHVHLRVFVENPDIEATPGMYYRRLYAEDKKYKEIHQEISELIETENETDVENAHEWQIPDSDFACDPIYPNVLNESETAAFRGRAKLRDDVSTAEALLTNRENGMTRSEIQDWRDD